MPIEVSLLLAVDSDRNDSYSNKRWESLRQHPMMEFIRETNGVRLDDSDAEPSALEVFDAVLRSEPL